MLRFRVYSKCKKCGLRFKRIYRGQWNCPSCRGEVVENKEVDKLKRRIIKLEKRLENRKTLYKDRQKLLKKLGGRCIRCGFDDWRALQIDHVWGGGTKELRELGGNKRSYYVKVLRDRSGKYQLLCANCNWIKRWENKEFNKVVE